VGVEFQAATRSLGKALFRHPATGAGKQSQLSGTNRQSKTGMRVQEHLKSFVVLQPVGFRHVGPYSSATSSS
jgi:hypothetical protein